MGEAWRQLLERAGKSQRALSEVAATSPGMVPLPRSTLGGILHGRRLPTREQLSTFLELVGVTEENEVEAWEEAWARPSEQEARFGDRKITTVLPVGTLLESGPKEAAISLVRRSIPEAASELAKVGPGSAAKILEIWPKEIAAEILSAMDVRAATAILLARRATWRVRPVLSKMPPEKAQACLAAMDVEAASQALGWTGGLFMPQSHREGDDSLFRRITKMRREQAATTVAVLAFFAGIVVGIGRALDRLEQRGQRTKLRRSRTGRRIPR